VAGRLLHCKAGKSAQSDKLQCWDFHCWQNVSMECTKWYMHYASGTLAGSVTG